MRIWVTGIGIVSPLGRDGPGTFDALLSGRRGFGEVTLFDTSGCRSHIAAQIRGLSVEEVAGTEAAGWSRTDTMAVLAAREALTDVDPAAPVDLVVGGTTAGMYETEDLLAEMHTAGPTPNLSHATEELSAREPLMRMLSHPLSATADRMREVVRPFRRARTVCSACSSGANALLLAAAWMRTKKSGRVLAGGADGLCRLTYTGFNCLGALDTDPCRPFDAKRNGLSLGEGAAFLLLETEEEARARGVDPIAELRGWAVGAEAHHITNPEPSGRTAARVMREALARARLEPDCIDYVNAHGTATPLNDRMESAALRQCFGNDVMQVAVSSTKGQIGHTLGAAGAIEAAVTVMALARGVLPPTAGLENVDPDCALDHVTSAREHRVRAAMSNSFGFGGSDAVVVFAQPNLFPDEEPALPRRVYVSAAASLGALGLVGSLEGHRAVEPGPAPAAGQAPFEAKEHLDLERARRMDRAGRLAAASMQRALLDAELSDDEELRDRAGAIVGESFGNIDDCSAFIRRFFDKGAKFASPAVFPNLLPSSPVAHASIYHRLRGAVWSTADLSATAEVAMVTAAELCAAGQADMMLAGSVEQASPIAEAVLGPLWAGQRKRSEPRAEGTAVLLLGALGTRAAERPLCEVRWFDSWRGEVERPEGLPLPDGIGRAALFVACDDEPTRRAAELVGWARVPLHAVAPRVGHHEAAGGFAAAAAVAQIARGELDAALVLGVAPDRAAAMLLVACER